MDPPSPSEPPPPAYDAVQVEFDRKVSDAVERSLRIQESQSTDDQFEEWDEALFEANANKQTLDYFSARSQTPKSPEKARLAAQDTTGTSGSAHASSSANTLNTPSTSPRPKERPSWLVDEQIHKQTVQTPLSGPGATVSSSSASYLREISPQDEYPNEQLPAFSEIDNSLAGPRYEEVVRPPARYPTSQADSPPESPLDSVAGDGYESLPQRSLNLSPRRPYFDPRHYNAPSHSAHSRPPPPMRHSRPNASQPPLVHFDTKLAYSIDRTVLTEDEVNGPVDPASLYNSAVSSLMKAQTQTPVTRRLPAVPKADNVKFSGNALGSQTYPNQTQLPIPSPSRHQDLSLAQNSYFPGGLQPNQPISYSSFSQPPQAPPAPFQQPYHQANHAPFYPPNAPVARPPPPPGMLNVPPPPPPPGQWQSQPANSVYGRYGR